MRLSLSISGIMVRINKSDLIENVLSNFDKISMIKEMIKRETKLDNYLEEKTKELYNIESRYLQIKMLKLK